MKAEEECKSLREESSELKNTTQQSQLELTSNNDELKLKVLALYNSC